MKKSGKKIKKKEKKEGVLSYEFVDEENEKKSDDLIKEKKEEKGLESGEDVLEKKVEKKKDYIFILVILLIILLVIDIITLYFFRPDLFNFLKFQPKVIEVDKEVLRCSDGTPYDSCSKNKPYYCHNGELLKKAYTCGCPEGYITDFQDCKKA